MFTAIYMTERTMQKMFGLSTQTRRFASYRKNGSLEKKLDCFMNKQNKKNRSLDKKFDRFMNEQRVFMKEQTDALRNEQKMFMERQVEQTDTLRREQKVFMERQAEQHECLKEQFTDVRTQVTAINSKLSDFAKWRTETKLLLYAWGFKSAVAICAVNLAYSIGVKNIFSLFRGQGEAT